LPEIIEQDASSAIREIYADIKRAQGAPLVNLIYRHLATIPGGLEWVWGSVSTVWGYQRLQKAAELLPIFDKMLVLPTSLWRIAGVSENNSFAIRALIEDYNSTNAVNILAITALSQVLSRPELPAGKLQLAVPRTTGATEVRSGPPVPKLDSLAPDVLDLVLFANRIGEVQSPPMVASMFRHLAIWPGSLAVAAVLLLPMAETGRLQKLRQRTIAAAEIIAAELVADAPNGFPALPEPTARDHILEALDMFRTTLIAKMLPVGQILKSALALE
jgi:hypothetical protein